MEISFKTFMLEMSGSNLSRGIGWSGMLIVVFGSSSSYNIAFRLWAVTST